MEIANIFLVLIVYGVPIFTIFAIIYIVFKTKNKRNRIDEIQKDIVCIKQDIQDIKQTLSKH
jgi:hypothetical protein